MYLSHTITSFLGRRDVDYETIGHRHTMTSNQTAESSHVRRQQIAKGVLFCDDDDYVLAASPVTLVAGHDDVLLAARVQQLERADVETLIDRLTRHFDEDGLRFFAPRPSSGYVRTARTPDLATTPLDVALGQSIRSHRPTGGDGRTWQRWQNEIEMLLHDHPVNLAREAKSLPPLSGVVLFAD